MKSARIQSLAHLNDLTAAFPTPEYRTVEILAWKSECMLANGNRHLARELAEQAIEAAKDGSWFRRYDSARKKVA